MNKNEVIQAVYESSNLTELISKLKERQAEPFQYSLAMRLLLDKNAREAAVPFRGIFELTPLCNFDCKMCYVHLSAAQMKEKTILRAEAWEKIMLEAIEAGMMYATLTGGECLTHPDFERLYLFLQSHSVQVAVLTNAALLDEDKIEFFKKHPPASIQVTLYGANEDAYEKVTGKREFQRVIRNLETANAALLPVNLTVTPNFCLTKNEIEDIIRLASTFGVRFNVSSSLFTPRSSTERDIGFRDLSIEDYIDFFKLQAALKGETVTEECVTDLPPAGSTAATEAPKGLRCSGGRSSFNVTWDGMLVPCNRLAHINVSLLEESFRRAWDKIHKQVMEYLLPVECEACPYRPAAKNCAAAHGSQNPGHASPQECKWCKAMVRHSFAKTI